MFFNPKYLNNLYLGYFQFKLVKTYFKLAVT